MANLDNAALPYSLDAEQAVLGSILLDSKLISEVADKLTAQSFHIGLNSEIFGVMMQMFITGKPIDIITVMDNAFITDNKGNRKGIFDNQADAKLYLTKLMESAISPSSIVSYATIIAEKYMVRQLMFASNEIFNLANAGTEEPQDLLDFAETKIYDIRNEKDITGLMPIKPTVTEKVNEISVIAANPDAYYKKYTSTSFERLDKLIFGLAPADLIVIAGRPGMGKTTFAVNIAVNVAKKYRDKKVAVFTFEMSREQLVERILASEARVETDKMIKGEVDHNDWKNISHAVETLSELQIYIDETPNISIANMKAALRRMKNIGVVVIDYLQLMSTGGKHTNRVTEVGEITRNLKIMAKELNIPIILASQLSRDVEKRKEDKRPMASDLRDSGTIEQDADIVIMLYRESFYNKETEFPNKCECIVVKNRRGETGTFDLNFDGKYYSFTSAEFIHVSEY
ncbi:MAG: replicative DNA helicase [Oscillospiraceae bacterium]|jgi:replicative DNA helicase|nr:replicative DNA helicase [Oscillospiraceae bacterium]